MPEESLRKLPGIGPRTEAVLEGAGVNDLSSLANATARTLEERSGGELDAEKVQLWIQEAHRIEGMGPTGGARRGKLREMPGVGIVTELRLRSNGVQSIGDVLTSTPEEVAAAAGKSLRMAKAMIESALELRREAEKRERLPQPRLAERRWPGTRPPSPRHDPNEDLWPDDDPDWKESRTHPADCGLQVRSQREAWIADILYEEGIYFVHEPVVCGYRPDFYIPGWGVIVEFWGWDSKEYRERRRRKTEAYRTTGYLLISLESEDARNRDALHRTLRNHLLRVRPPAGLRD